MPIMTERKYETEAKNFVNAIKTIVNKPENLENLESYLSYHFKDWLEIYAHMP